MPNQSSLSEIPDVSVVICMLNPKAHLPNLLPQLEALDGSISSEVIFVDDGTTDGSTKALTQHVAKKPNWRLITLSENNGLGRARNAGMAQARGRYLYFFDVDDRFYVDGLKALIETADIHRADITIAPYTVATGFDGEPKDMLPSEMSIFGKLRETAPPGAFSLKDIPEVLSLIPYAHFKIINRSFAEETGFRYSANRIADDILPHWLGMIKASRLAWSDSVVSTYVNSDSPDRMGNYDDTRRMAVIDAVLELKTEVRALAPDIPNLEFLLERKCFVIIFYGYENTAPEHRPVFAERFIEYLEDVPMELLESFGKPGRIWTRRLAAVRAERAVEPEPDTPAPSEAPQRSPTLVTRILKRLRRSQ